MRSEAFLLVLLLAPYLSLRVPFLLVARLFLFVELVGMKEPDHYFYHA